ncbi:MAG: hypothetical protein WD513_04540 [Balneolaceae bacterium]
MQKSIIIHLIFCVTIMAGVAACGSSLIIQEVDYSQPVESVLAPDSENSVQDQRYAVKFSISGVLEDEGISAVNQIRLIRNSTGFYFLTANGFQNVYKFQSGEGTLKLIEKIRVSENGLGQPAFNQRGTHIELVDGSTGETYNLD